MTSSPTERELRFVGLLVAVLLCAMVIVCMASWMLASLGFQVESLFSDEAIRWIFTQSAGTVLAPLGQWMLLAAVVAGAIGHSGLFASDVHSHTARWSAVAVWFLMLSLLALFFFAPWSPLRSATGRLFPTPFLFGFLRALAVSIVVAAAVYGGISGRLRTWSQYVTMFFIGIQRFAPWLITTWLAVLLYHIIIYAF